MRVSVVAWSLGHNAVSRGWFLADLLRRRHEVELVGPLSIRWGTDLWQPIRRAGDVPIRSFVADDLPCFLEEIDRLAAGSAADLVYVSKPRLPSALLGSVFSERLRVPLVVDVDDEEPSVGDGEDWMRRAAPELLEEADAVTVASEPLQERYGGTLVGQARDERLFDPALYDRRAERASLGFSPDDLVVLFVGTPRRHKGVGEVARALAELDDRRLRLCVVGAGSDRELLAELGALPPVRVLDFRPVTEVPRLLVAGDLVCVNLDPESALARAQVPMKLSEAMAMGVPVLAGDTPAVASYVRQELVFPLGNAPLAERIAAVLGDPDARRERAEHAREHFLSHLSYRAVGDILDGVLAEADGSRERPRWRARVAGIRREPPCSFDHPEHDREVTAKLVARLVRELSGAVTDALGDSKHCAVLGYPNHRNPGDHAIWLATKRLLRRLEVAVDYVCDWQTYSRDALGAVVESGATILLAGGGNFGDLWPNTQGLREQVLTDFPGAPTIQLPQSIHFESDENRGQARTLLERHGNVRLLLRDRRSLELAQRWFEVPAQLVPDLGFLTPLPALEENAPSEDIVWVARGDKESAGFFPLPDAEGVQLCDWMAPRETDALPSQLVHQLHRSAQLTRRAAAGEDVDPAELSAVWDRVSRRRLELACSVLTRGRVVVTDRLHVHVLCLLLGLPSVVGDNSYGKVSGVYDTYTDAAPTARWARTPAEALAIARDWVRSLEEAEPHLVE